MPFHHLRIQHEAAPIGAAIPHILASYCHKAPLSLDKTLDIHPYNPSICREHLVGIENVILLLRPREGQRRTYEKILVVDNDHLILTFMTDMLSRKGYQVVTALDGLSALELLKTYTPEIIFIDLIMPRIDGRKLCRLIRDMDDIEEAYLIILSGTAVENQSEVIDFGADARIAKGPFQEMAQHILDVLANLDFATSRC